MKKVFFGLSGGYGPVQRCIPIAELLKTDGIESVFSIYGPSSDLIEEMGYKHFPDDDPTFPKKELIVQPGPMFYNLDHYFAQVGLLDENFVMAWVYHRINMLKNIKPDLVVTDLSPQTTIAARYLNIPIVSITQSCFHPKGDPIHFWGESPRNLPKVTPIINRVLKRLSLPLINRMEDLNSGDVDIVPSFPELDPIKDEEKNVFHVGPIELQINYRQHKYEDKLPYILVYPGRLHDSSGPTGIKLVQSVISAFHNKQEKVFIATNEEITADQSKISKNITIIPYFSNEFLKSSSLYIHHGGHGSCLSAITNSLPSLIIPTHMEREFNARKVASLGLGEYMVPDTFTSDHLYQMSKFIIEDQYKEHTTEFLNKMIIRNYKGAEHVLSIIRNIFNGGIK